MQSAVLVVTLAVVTWNRSASYANAETLFRDTIARNPHAWMAYQNLGTELAAQNRLPEAIEAYEAHYGPDPAMSGRRTTSCSRVCDSVIRWPTNLADRTAIANYEAVVRLEPDHFRAHYNLGTLLMGARAACRRDRSPGKGRHARAQERGRAGESGDCAGRHSVAIG